MLSHASARTPAHTPAHTPVRTPARTPARTLAGLVLMLAVLLDAGPAASVESYGLSLGEFFGMTPDKTNNLTVSERELSSLGCLVTAAGVGIATVFFGGAAIIVTRGQGAAAATTVAVPVIAATMTAGCALGSQAAPGLLWLRRNGEAIFGSVVNAIPVEPLSRVLSPSRN
ncbi:MAG: hypothetical protein WCK65_02825 [Rhodospirillaceae bacterium]